MIERRNPSKAATVTTLLEPTDAPMTDDDASLHRCLCVLVCGVACFHLALALVPLRGLVIVHLFGLWWLGSHKPPRAALNWGLLYGLATLAPQLSWMMGIFGAFAALLWSILALWIGLFTFVLAAARRKLEPRSWSMVLLSGLCLTGMEFARGEINPLRFSWMTTGFVLGPHPLLPWLGYYGSAGILMMIAASVGRPGRSLAVRAATLCVVVLALAWQPKASVSSTPSEASGPHFVGIQLEFPNAKDLFEHLNAAIADHPETELVVLSEYTFGRDVPAVVRTWVDAHDLYLIAGGTEQTADGKFNTAFVVDPEGKVVFRQAKSQPIQFFDDGEPATTQRCWSSPWGLVGLAICYDLSYTRFIDRLVDQGAQALIIPTMDVTHWGRGEHEQHARIAPMRAAESGLPILRVCSSGISQVVAADGVVLQTAPFPGQGRRVVGRLPMLPAGTRGRVPLMRHLSQVLGYAFMLSVVMAAVWLIRQKGSPGPG